MFNYAEAVKVDVNAWLADNVSDWGAYPTPQRWAKEIADFECSLLENVCGSCDGRNIKYEGERPATETDIVASLPEISNIVTEFLEPDELAYLLKEEGIYIFDWIARRYALMEYLGSGEFLAEIEKRMEEYRITEFDRKRNQLIKLCDSGMMTVDEALSQYEVMLLTYGKLN